MLQFSCHKDLTRFNPKYHQVPLLKLDGIFNLYQNSITVIYLMLYDLCCPSRQFLTLFFP